MGLLSFESKPEQPSTENAAVPAEKSTDEQAPPKEAFVKPSEAQEWTMTDESGVGE